MLKTIATYALAMGFCGALASPGFAQQSPAPTPAPSSSEVVRPAADNVTDPRMNMDFFKREMDIRRVFTEPAEAQTYYASSAKVAKCLARRMDTSRLIGGPLSDDEGHVALTESLSGTNKRCLDKTAGALPWMVAAELASERLAAMDLDWQDAANSLNVTEAQAFYLPKEGEKATLDVVARCVSAYSPGLVYKALSTESGSASERPAFDAAFSQSPKCGVSAAPEGVPMPIQRASFAFALYRWMTRDGSATH